MSLFRSSNAAREPAPVDAELAALVARVDQADALIGEALVRYRGNRAVADVLLDIRLALRRGLS